MATSRARMREMKKLRGDAADIWGETREVLGHSAQFWKEAGAEAASVAVQEVAPRVKAAIDNQVKPAVSTGVASATTAATAAAATAKERFVNDVAPAVSSAVASSSLGDILNDPKVAEFVKNGKKAGKKLSKKAKKRAIKQAAKAVRKHPKAAVKVAKAAKAARSVQKQHSKKSGIGAGGVFLIILGIIGVGALVYAAVQTLRADDELWVADDDDKAAS